MALFEMGPLLDIIKLVLQTGYVKNKSHPVSLLIMAKPESAKTASMEQFKPKKNVRGTFVTNNITQAVIVSKVFPMIKNEGLKHMIIPDILNVTEKDSTTKKGCMNMMKTLMEEGITSLDTFNMRTKETYNPPLQCGIITGITNESFYGTFAPEKGRRVGGLQHYLRVTGILSRFTPFSYKYKAKKIKKIFEFIENQEHMGKSPEHKIYRTLTEITSTSKLFKQLELISMPLGKEQGGYGIRMQRTLQTLVKASAIQNRKKKVRQADIDKIIELSDWMNYDFNPL